jgi:hypothetical protein
MYPHIAFMKIGDALNATKCTEQYAEAAVRHGTSGKQRCRLEKTFFASSYLSVQALSAV